MQLARRVREMRETRTAATTYAPATRLRKSINIVDVVPRGEDFIDPLGLGYVHQKHSCAVHTPGRSHLPYYALKKISLCDYVRSVFCGVLQASSHGFRGFCLGPLAVDL